MKYYLNPIYGEKNYGKKLETELEMTAWPMDEKDIRELSCKEHKGVPYAVCLEHRVRLRCKHCGKFMGESDDEAFYEFIVRKELRGL